MSQELRTKAKNRFKKGFLQLMDSEKLWKMLEKIETFRKEIFGIRTKIVYCKVFPRMDFNLKKSEKLKYL